MKAEQFDDYRDALFIGRCRLWKQKNASYTSEGESGGDTLENFRVAAQQLNVEPATVAWVYLWKQVASLARQVRGGPSAGEGIKQRCMDAANFLDVIYALSQEDEDEGDVAGSLPSCSPGALAERLNAGD